MAPTRSGSAGTCSARDRLPSRCLRAPAARVRAVLFPLLVILWGRPSIWLDARYVYPGGRRQGAGHRLMVQLAEVAAAADCTHIAWVASASNAVGVGFYRRPGAAIVHHGGDSVTLQIEPAGLRERRSAAQNRAPLDSTPGCD
ncbi:MAG TPA: GNAT family N-acetyltransferase [Gemmata sp.]